MKEKGKLLAVSLIGIFVLVYGTAIICRVIFGDFVFAGGLLGFNYLLLAVLCTIPFLMASLFMKRIDGLLLSMLLFASVLILLQLVMGTREEAITGAILVRTLIVLPVTALLTVMAAGGISDRSR